MARNSNQKRHPAGAPKSIGGQYAADNQRAGAAVAYENPALTPEMIEEIEDGRLTRDARDIIDRELNSMNDYEFDLAFVDYDHRLQGEDVDHFLVGDPHGDLEESIEEQFDEARADAAYRVATEVLEKLGVPSPGDDAITDIAQSIRDRDNTENSDVIADLARNTHPQLMRAPIGEVHIAAHQEFERANGFSRRALYGGESDTQQARAAFLAEKLHAAGLDTDRQEVKDAVNDLVSEGPEYWHEAVTLDAIWYGDIRDAALPAAAEQEVSRSIVLGGAPAHSKENPQGHVNVVLLDSANGSGYAASIPGTLNLTLTPESPAKLDSGGDSAGYGWDDTAGVYKPAFAVDVRDAEGQPQT